MVRETITLGRPYGVRVDVSLTWLAIGLVTLCTLAWIILPGWYPDWPPVRVWSMAVMATLIFFLSVLVHELGHALAAHRLGIAVQSVTLFLFGGVARYRREPRRARLELIIAVAGPAVSLTLGLAALIAGRTGGELFPLFRASCYWIAGVNLSLAVFNLLPWQPLDGGRALRALAWFASGDLQWANRVALLAGQLGAVALIIAGVFMLARQQGTAWAAAWLMLLGWFLRSAAVTSYQSQSLMLVLDRACVGELMQRRLGRVERDSHEADLLTTPRSLWGPDYYVVTHQGQDIGVVAMHGLTPETEPRDYSSAALHAALNDVIRPLDPDATLDEAATAADALQIFVERDMHWVPVVRDAQVVGVIRRLDVAEYVERHRT